MPDNPSSGPFDAATLQVLWTRLIACVDEAAAALVRTSFSTLVRESHDFSCVITDELGQSLVQATRSIPSFIGTLPATVKHFIREYPPEDLNPGDVLITNDLHQGTGHLPDISVAKPIYFDGTLIGFAASTAHAPDIGGKIRSPEPREVFEEGFQIPIMKLQEGGKTNETLIKLLKKNVRTPDATVGDLWAQIVALDMMEARVLQLMASYGFKVLRPLAEEIQDRCERAMRKAIFKLPDGEYHSSLKTDGLIDKPIHLEMTLTVDGDTIDIDYSGSDPQVDRAINVCMCYTYAFTVYGVKCCTSPDLPNNEGAFRPITVRGPDGCVVNPVFPTAGGSRMLVGHYLPILVFGCLGSVVPKQVMAACGSPMWGMNQSGVNAKGKPYTNMFFYNGGMGATYRRDGTTCLSWPSNVSSTPIELSEQLAPLRFHCKQLRPDSGGSGKFRGGLGQEILIESRSDRLIAVSFLAERTIYPAFGIEGGGEGEVGVLKVNGKRTDPKKQYVLKRGETVYMATPGGGGHGPPASRDKGLLEQDLIEGYVTRKSDYEN